MIVRLVAGLTVTTEEIPDPPCGYPDIDFVSKPHMNIMWCIYILEYYVVIYIPLPEIVKTNEVQ